MKNSKLLLFIMVAGVCMMLFGCGDQSNQSVNDSSEKVAVNKLFIPDDYESILKELELTEIVAKPRFKSPFFTIARNQNNEQLVVLIRDTGEVTTTKLPKTLEEIIQVLQAKGFSITASNENYENLLLLEINKQIVWNYEEDSKVYLNLEGNEIDPFN